MTDERSASPPCGTVTLSLLAIEVPVELIVQYWTREEAAALLAGDEDAKQELISQAASRRELWSGYELGDADVMVEGRRL